MLAKIFDYQSNLAHIGDGVTAAEKPLPVRRATNSSIMISILHRLRKMIESERSVFRNTSSKSTPRSHYEG